MTQNHVLWGIMPRFHSKNPGRSLKVIENWPMIRFEIKINTHNEILFGFKGEIVFKTPFGSINNF